MNARSLILIALAGVGVILIFMLSNSFLSNVQNSAPVQVIETKILVAARSLPRGTILKDKDLRWQLWPNEAMNNAYYSTGKMASLNDKVVKIELPAGSPVTKGALVSQGEKGFMAAILTPGMRAASITINKVSGVSGFIVVNDRVDLILTHTLTGESSGKKPIKYPLSETVLQNVRVLSIDSLIGKGSKGATATLEVTPKVVEKLALLPRMGTLSLALRSLPADDGKPSDDPIGETLTHTFGDEVSRFTPSLFKKQNANAKSMAKPNGGIVNGQGEGSVRIDRGAASIIKKIDDSKGDK